MEIIKQRWVYSYTLIEIIPVGIFLTHTRVCDTTRNTCSIKVDVEYCILQYFRYSTRTRRQVEFKKKIVES